MSDMSPNLLPRGARDGLVPLMVHPSDHDRLKALSGIWPVEDTLTRLIDVFIASGGAAASSGLRATAVEAPQEGLAARGVHPTPRVEDPAQARAPEPSGATSTPRPAPPVDARALEPPKAPSVRDSVAPTAPLPKPAPVFPGSSGATRMPSGSSSAPAVARAVRQAEPEAVPARSLPASVRASAAKPAVKTALPKPAPASVASATEKPVEIIPPAAGTILIFTRNDSLDLRFTSLDGFSFGPVTREGEALPWACLFEEAVVQACAAGHSIAAMGEIGVRMKEGRHTKTAFRYCPRIDRSVQLSSSTYVFTRIMRIADLLGVPVKAGIRWEDRPDAAHPGQRGLFSARPIAGATRLAVARRAAGAPSGDLDFPVPGAIVGYVYMDRPDDDKIALLVEGSADPEAGQVSVRSPLGRALLETAKGHFVEIEVKGTQRRIKVLEILRP
jgi:hypothetical protein